jgi:hypothetical protein
VNLQDARRTLARKALVRKTVVRKSLARKTLVLRPAGAYHASAAGSAA